MILDYILVYVGTLMHTMSATEAGYTWHPAGNTFFLAVAHYAYSIEFIVPMTEAVLPMVVINGTILVVYTLKNIIFLVINIFGLNGARL